MNGRLDLTRRSSLSAEANFARGAQNPEDEEAGAQEQPTITTAPAPLRIRRDSTASGGVATGATRREADNGDEASQQDRTSYTISPGVDYALSRG